MQLSSSSPHGAGEMAERPELPAGTPPDPFVIGATLQNRYRLESLLFSDEDSLIYRARDLHWDLPGICTDVGIKVFQPELRMQPQWIARLKREFYQTRLIKHPNIVRMYGLECHEGHWFIAMELLRGVSLADQFRRLSGPLPPQRGAAIFAACRDALDFAHERRISHGDLRPSNVFLLSSGGVRLLGFGASVTYTPPAIGKAEKWSLPRPDSAETASTLLPALPDTRDDATALANLARELLISSPLPQLGDAGMDNLSKSRNQLVNQAAPGTGVLTPHSVAPATAASAANVEITVDATFTAPKIEPPAATVAIEQAASVISVTAMPTSAVQPAPRKPELCAAPSKLATQRAEHVAAQNALTHWKILGAAFVFGVGAWIFTHLGGSGSAKITSAPPPQAAAVVGTRHAQESERAVAAVNKLASGETSAPDSRLQPLAKGTDAGRPKGQNGGNAAAKLPKQEIAFDIDAITVSARASAAALTLKRHNGRQGRLRVKWKIIPGSATAGRDFGGPTSGSIVFADRQVVKTLYVPLIATGADSGQRNFTVEITEVSNGARIATQDSVTVSIRNFG